MSDSMRPKVEFLLRCVRPPLSATCRRTFIERHHSSPRARPSGRRGRSPACACRGQRSSRPTPGTGEQEVVLLGGRRSQLRACRWSRQTRCSRLVDQRRSRPPNALSSEPEHQPQQLLLEQRREQHLVQQDHTELVVLAPSAGYVVPLRAGPQRTPARTPRCGAASRTAMGRAQKHTVCTASQQWDAEQESGEQLAARQAGSGRRAVSTS